MNKGLGTIHNIEHDEITPVILLNTALDYFLFTCDVASKYPDRKVADPISVLENSYATVSLLLLANSIEGYLNRLTYLEYKECNAFDEVARKTIDAKLLEFLKKSSKYKEIKSQFDEIYVVRSAITHSHIYRTERTMDRVIVTKEKLILKQDERWKKSVSHDFRTKKLKLNAIPSEINYEDVMKCFEFWDTFYLEIQRFNKNIAYLPPLHPHIYKRYINDHEIKIEIDQVNTSESLLKEWVKIGKTIAKRK